MSELLAAHQTLATLADQADQLGYSDYAAYCRLREKGLRREALEKLSAFISTIQSVPAVQQRAFADWLLTQSFNNPDLIDAYPTPLKRDFLVPAIHAWCTDEPENGKALRWSDDARTLLVAARTLPPDEIAIGRYSAKLLSAIDYATHELPHGYLGEGLHEDLADIQTVLDLLNRVPNAPFFEADREEALLLKLKLQKALKS